jgi:hypothetical protein
MGATPDESMLAHGPAGHVDARASGPVPPGAARRPHEQPRAEQQKQHTYTDDHRYTS